MRTTDALSVTHDGAVLQVAFTRPERLNAVTADGLDDLADLLEEAAEDAASAWWCCRGKAARSAPVPTSRAT